MEDEVKYETPEQEKIDYKCLDLGGGKWRKPGYISIDNNEASEFQGMTEEDFKWTLVWDLNKGIPYPDNCIGDIYMSHALEHMKNPDFMLEEIWRVCFDKAHVTIIVPLHEMESVGHITEFGGFWFENRILDKFPGKFAMVRKEILRNKEVEIRKEVGSVPRLFDELTIVLKIIK